MLKSILSKLIMVTWVITFSLFATNIANAKPIKFNAKSNKKTFLTEIYIYNTATCYSGPLPRIEKAEAKHGKVIIEKATFRPKKGPCKGSLIKGYNVFYKSNRGFRGTDTGLLKYSYQPYDGRPQRRNRTLHGIATVK